VLGSVKALCAYCAGFPALCAASALSFNSNAQGGSLIHTTLSRESIHCTGPHHRGCLTPAAQPQPHPQPPQDDGYIPEDTERRIFETLLRIKRKDPAIYDSSVAFFPAAAEGEGGDEEEDGEAARPRAQKPVYLKDVLARQVGVHWACAAASSAATPHACLF